MRKETTMDGKVNKILEARELMNNGDSKQSLQGGKVIRGKVPC